MIYSSGIIPLRKQNQKWEYLLLRCYKYWDFPKGEIDNGEDFLAAALREFTEETSIQSIELAWGEVYYETEAYSKGKIARYYPGLLKGPEQVALLPNPVTKVVEHHEFRWVSYEEAMKMTNPRIQKVLEWAKSIIN